MAEAFNASDSLIIRRSTAFPFFTFNNSLYTPPRFKSPLQSSLRLQPGRRDGLGAVPVSRVHTIRLHIGSSSRRPEESTDRKRRLAGRLSYLLSCGSEEAC